MIASVIDTGEQLIPDKHKVASGPNGIPLRGPEIRKLNHVKNLKSKLSCQTPFKKTIRANILRRTTEIYIVISLILKWFKMYG